MHNNSEKKSSLLMGLEIHITLNSQKKIFNWENVYQGDIPPNSQVGPWELGYLGVLPIINPEVIQLGLKLAAALTMKISKTILFDRKIYNYFDLPKGYQITQQEFPFATNGYLPIILENKIEKLPIKTLQLEEDTAKSIYSQEGIRLDFNRAGNPLIELVTEPIFSQVETVLIFIQQLQNLLRYLDISQAKMEKGQLRVDLNFSLRLGENYSTPRYEIKNLNSLANIEKALKYEINQHQLLFSQGQNPPPSQTLGFDEAKQITITHREKTNYYYLPEVNIPPIKLKNSEIQQISKKLPKLPWQYWEKVKEIDLQTANKLLKSPFLLKIFNFLAKKKKWESKGSKNWTTFYLNYLSPQSVSDINLFAEKWQSYYRLFEYWKEKKLGNEAIIEIIHSLLTTEKTFSSLVKKYEKKGKIDKNLIEQELKNLWNSELASKLATEQQRVQNYLLGQVKRKFTDYSVPEIIGIIQNFLKEKSASES
ncbi:MAG: Asp-tRNA(Asn)/Glu-tRNA(Gln) amidotransferase subunit GatB [Candidatus Moeniiplasma glomeromycotorum]|nr:Asp-tRNA(Asn)/Glu-tRNA(Gln) amidotransferase subunit GatB [Candidatus Moeniiplasma glomeromycotorum]